MPVDPQQLRYGSIVNISSVYSHEGAAGASVYVASKHAVEGLTKSAALDVVGSGVPVNAVAPGPIEPSMINRFTVTPENKAALVSTVPFQRIVRVEEIASATIYVVSDAASYMTGQIVTVDGGITAAEAGPLDAAPRAAPLSQRTPNVISERKNS